MVHLVSNIRLDDTATGTSTGIICEPTVAMSGLRMMVTGNWFASRSTDGGQTWTHLDPFTEFPSDHGRFCCDQIVHYSREHRLWVWLLQYMPVAGSNIVRVAVSRTGRSGSWHYWDVRPVDADPSWTEVWLDYPDLAESAQHLYLSFNAFDSTNAWRGASVLRFPFADLLARENLARRAWSTSSFGSLRFAQGSSDIMWFAAHTGSATRLQVFSWADDEADVVSRQVGIGPWSSRSYASTGPDGVNWLARTDWRITAGWRGQGLLGFAWTASPRPGRPHNYVRVVRIDEQAMIVVDEPDLWSPSGAWAYPAAAPNARGEAGLAAFFGGPTHPAHAVGHLDGRTGAWDMTVTSTSTHSPPQAAWGDYLSVRRHPALRTRWVASGYTLEGGQNRRNVEPRVVVFGP